MTTPTDVPDDGLVSGETAAMPTPIPAESTLPLVVGTEGELLPGTAYRLLTPLGSGGMGQVFRGEHIELGRPVAIKLLAPQLSDDAAAMERLKREARAAARLGNPHIIDVYDLGVADDGRAFVVMRIIDGHDLHCLIEASGAFAPERTVRLVKQMANALADAHALGIVHRDLKPENVMVEARVEGEHITLLDFGIAHSLQDADTRLTRTGQVIGTPGYMAPEQALSKPVDGRADQYSLAVITYELLSGDAPYERITPLQVIAAQLTKAPRHLSDQPGAHAVTPAMQAVVHRGMSTDPNARYSSVTAFAQALEASLAAPVAVAPPARPWWPWALGAVVVLGLGLLVAAPWRSPEPATAPALTAAQSAQPASAVVAPDAGAPPDAAPPAPDAATPDAATPTAAAPTAAAPDASVKIAARPTTRRRARPRAVTKPVAKPPAKPVAKPPAKPVAKPTPAPTPVVVAATPPPAVPARAPAPIAPTPPPPPKLVNSALSFGAPTVRGGVSQRDVRRSLSGAEARIRSCVGDLSARPLRAQATLSFIIDDDGFFTDPGGQGDGALVRCGKKTLPKLRLKRRPDTGDIRVTWPVKVLAQ